MSTSALLPTLAEELWGEARRFVPAVFAAGPGAVPAPLGQLILAQGAPDDAAFQLPDPLSGPIPDEVPVLVVGLNPGLDPDEDIPRLGTPLLEYVAWYERRFSAANRDGHGRPVR